MPHPVCWPKHRLALPGCLLCLLLAGCQAASSSAAPVSSASAASSSTSISSSAVPPQQASSSSLPPASQLLPDDSPAPLLVSDFAAYLDGDSVLGPLDVAFQRFSFQRNALGHKLDALALSTERGLRLGSPTADILAAYPGLPVDIRADGNRVSARYEDYGSFLESENPPTDYYAVFFLYMVDGAAAELPAAEAAIAANAAGPVHTLHRYELIFHIQSGVVADILLSFSDTTPFVLGSLDAPRPLLETESLAVSLNGLFASPESFGFYLGLRNGFDQGLVAVCTATMVSGKAPRDIALLNQHVPAFSYVDALLEIPNDTIHAAGVERVDQVSFTIELRTEQGRTVYNSGPLTARFGYPEETPLA